MKKASYKINQIKITPIAEQVVFQKTIENIFETLLLSKSFLTEAEGLSSEEQKAMDSLMNTFVTQLKKMAPEVKKTAANKTELEKIKDKYPSLDKLEAGVQESELNEFVITGTLVAGIVAAIPTIIKLFGYLAKGISTALAKFGFKKSSGKTEFFANKVIHASHELHHKYISAVRGGLQFLIPEFNTLPKDKQETIAEIVYMVIVMYLGIDAGINAAHALHQTEWAHFGLEGGLTAIKSGELGVWLTSAITKAVT